MKKKIIFICCFVLLVLLSACNPLFVLRAAYEESKILLGRRDISEVVTDQSTDSSERLKLELVLEAREFSAKMGLTPEDSYTMYTKIDRDVLLWVLAGSKPDAFDLYTWWYPFVGRIPYKGYFERAGAEREAAKLEKKGYETSIRPSDAFSTLGWFNDPILSTTLRAHHTEIVGTVIHETLHRTIWIPDQVPFNESLANFVGYQGAIEMFEQRAASAPIDSKEAFERDLEIARWNKDAEFEISDVVVQLYQELNALYESKLDYSEKIKLRDGIFKRLVGPLREKFPDLRILKAMNNADIMQLKFYMTGLRDFQLLYESSQSDWKIFFQKIQEIKNQIESSKRDPFDLLRELTRSP
ncbi:MAG: aminopeptidase [Bdellovibrionales bacterium]|nr:aminopeptidase [Bdellovibrionales bacterium]